MEHFLIYGLIDPRSGELRYVGRSSSGLKRPMHHMTASAIARDSNVNKSLWLLELKRDNVPCDIEILEECDTFEQSMESEKFFIQYFAFVGCDLLNIHQNPHKSRYYELLPLTTPSYREAKKKFEDAYFRDLIKRTGGTMEAMAHVAGMHRSTLYDKLKKLRIWV